MKTLVVALLISLNCLGASWVIEKKHAVYILKNAQGDFYQVRSEGEKPKLIGKKDLDKAYSLVIYEYQLKGSQSSIATQRAVVFKHGKYRADIPYQYFDQENEETIKVEVKVGAKGFEAYDPTTNKNWRL